MLLTTVDEVVPVSVRLLASGLGPEMEFAPAPVNAARACWIAVCTAVSVNWALKDWS